MNLDPAGAARRGFFFAPLKPGFFSILTNSQMHNQSGTACSTCSPRARESRQPNNPGRTFFFRRADGVDRAAETGNWIDPTDVPNNWECIVYNVDGKHVGDGNALTPGMALGLAWLCVEAPDALMNAYVEPGSVAFDVPEGFQFELKPPREP